MWYAFFSLFDRPIVSIFFTKRGARGTKTIFNISFGLRVCPSFLVFFSLLHYFFCYGIGKNALSITKCNRCWNIFKFVPFFDNFYTPFSLIVRTKWETRRKIGRQVFWDIYICIYENFNIVRIERDFKTWGSRQLENTLAFCISTFLFSVWIHSFICRYICFIFIDCWLHRVLSHVLITHVRSPRVIKDLAIVNRQLKNKNNQKKKHHFS